MRKFHPMIATLAVVSIAFVACEQRPGEETGAAEEEAPGDTMAPEAGLEQLETEYERAYSQGDWEGLMVLHTDDYQEVTPEGEVRGVTEFEGSLRDTAQAPPEGAELNIETEEMVIAESGDIAYATGTSTITATGPDGRETTEEFRWLAGFERSDGEWRIDRLVTVPTGGQAPTAAPEPMAPGGTETETAPADTTVSM